MPRPAVSGAARPVGDLPQRGRSASHLTTLMPRPSSCVCTAETPAYTIATQCGNEMGWHWRGVGGASCHIEAQPSYASHSASCHRDLLLTYLRVASLSARATRSFFRHHRRSSCTWTAAA